MRVAGHDVVDPGARYCSQSASNPKNLSRPKRIGATVKTVRRRRNA
jgi:hypothetical protein